MSYIISSIIKTIFLLLLYYTNYKFFDRIDETNSEIKSFMVTIFIYLILGLHITFNSLGITVFKEYTSESIIFVIIIIIYIYKLYKKKTKLP